MSETSHSEQNLAEKTVCVLLVRGENPDGNGIYAYVAVRADRLETFMNAQSSGLFYPEDYGVIIEAGEGVPSLEVRRKMEDEYGFNHDMMIDLPDTQSAVDVTQSLQETPRSA